MKNKLRHPLFTQARGSKLLCVYQYLVFEGTAITPIAALEYCTFAVSHLRQNLA